MRKSLQWLSGTEIFDMTSDEEKNLDAWVEDMQTHHYGNLDYPWVGRVLTPICQVCKNAEMFYGTWKEPVCKVYGKMPDEYLDCKSYKCPGFIHDKESIHNRFIKIDDEE